MSHVTTVVVCCPLDEPGIAKLNELVSKREPPLVNACEGVFLDGKWAYQIGGYKAAQQEVWIAAFRFISYDEFTEMVQSVQWESPNDIQVLICDEDSQRFFLAFGKMPTEQPESL